MAFHFAPASKHHGPAVSTAVVATGIALCLFWFAYKVDFLPAYDLVWWFYPDTHGISHFAAKTALGYVLSIAWMALLIYSGLRLTGTWALFRVGLIACALIACAMLLPVVVAATMMALDPSTRLQADILPGILYVRKDLNSISAMMAGVAISLALFGNWFEVRCQVRRRYSAPAS